MPSPLDRLSNTRFHWSRTLQASATVSRWLSKIRNQCSLIKTARNTQSKWITCHRQRALQRNCTSTPTFVPGADMTFITAHPLKTESVFQSNRIQLNIPNSMSDNRRSNTRTALRQENPAIRSSCPADSGAQSQPNPYQPRSSSTCWWISRKLETK